MNIFLRDKDNKNDCRYESIVFNEMRGKISFSL